MYHHYKPLRNFVAKLDRDTSLLQICQFYQNIASDIPIPMGFCRLNPKGLPSVKHVIHAWELDILAREVILNCGSGGTKNLFVIKDFIAVVNLIRKMQDIQVHGRLEDMIFQEMHRIIQQQFPWQTSSTELRLSRYFRIYRTPEIETLLKEETGLSIKQFYLLGVAVSGNFISKNGFNIKTDFTGFGISDEQRDSFFERVVMDVESLKERTKSVQEYNENWSYTINPLQSTPLVAFNSALPHMVICPIPNFLLTRISEGLFFDLLNIKGFENPYGNAFEKYVGEITEELITTPDIAIEAGKEYFVKKDRKHGVDWYVFDGSAAMLVECKAKRLNLKARYQLEEEALLKEVDLLAKFIVQNYKNLNDVVAGYTEWRSESRSLHPVVVTLSEWNLFGPSISQRIEKTVLGLLAKAGLDSALLEQYPYTVMSVEEYETAIQIISKVGLAEFFNEKNNHEHKSWLVMPFINSRYSAELPNVRRDYLRSELDIMREDWNLEFHGAIGAEG